MIKGKHLHLDCFAGISGDMFLGAMIDLGVPEGYIREELSKLDLQGYELQVGWSKRSGIAGCDIQVIDHHPHPQPSPAQADAPTHHAPHLHVHMHVHDHQAHKHQDPSTVTSSHPHICWKDIRSLIEKSTLTEGAKQRAVSIFERLARAEGRLHAQKLEDVMFHEVGAIDSIVDIVGAAIALDYLAPTKITSRPVPLGHGMITCAHGRLPIPAPATLEILAGAAVEDGGVDAELCTPTGAAIITCCVQEFSSLPSATVISTGYGVGDRLLPDRPNLLRVILFEPDALDATEREAVVIEANIDNMSPELCGYVMEQLFSAGARDVWFTPIVMKKGRPALTLGALCAAEKKEQVENAILRETTTIGLRFYPVGRRTLQRRFIEVATPFGPVQIKLAEAEGRVQNASPEFESCKKAAVAHNVPLKNVYLAAMAAYQQELDNSR